MGVQSDLGLKLVEAKKTGRRDFQYIADAHIPGFTSFLSSMIPKPNQLAQHNSKKSFQTLKHGAPKAIQPKNKNPAWQHRAIRIIKEAPHLNFNMPTHKTTCAT